MKGHVTGSQNTPALMAFFVLAFGWTWGLWWVSSAGGPWPIAVSVPLLLLSGFGPTLAAIGVVWRFDGRAGLQRWLCRGFAWRLAVGWYVLAFTGPAVIMLAALAVHVAFGGVLPASPAAGHLGLTMLQFAVVLVLGGPLGEEFGWRGFALPALALRFGWRLASLIVGAIWALWHVPLFYMPGMAQAQMPIALFLASSVALSVVFARLSVNAAFSVLPAIVLHWSVNAWSWVIPVTPQGAEIRPYMLVTSLLFMAAAVVFFKPGPSTSDGSLRP